MNSAVESFVGAVFLDQGLDFTYKLVRNVFEEDVKNGQIHQEQNPKSLLQECMQADHKESVTYKIVGESGLSHKKTFVAAVYFEDEELGRGVGPSKKAAETAAAKDALEKMAPSHEGE